ncbi:hypothetical protein OW763_09300 [Clostridium aestuarii]|uniref:Adhesin domain-containing protein n=1 Tax=Clostridium aestuarii TaxID=338193 RepID=A0ABT4D2M9_9CLOT|nr:hypothetical protein [Clostridium aestuarii]MCY6484535.1 hypothetical protein [Clostridium aestuarii]
MSKNKIVAVILSISIGSALINYSLVHAKTISNSLKTTINVVKSNSELDFVVKEASELNKAITLAGDKGIVKVVGGEHRLNSSIINKDVTIKSSDGKEVDIIVEDIPKDIKIKVGDKVTINKEGVAPIKLIGKIIYNNKVLEINDEEMTIDVKKDDEVKIELTKEVVNKLGFHNMNVFLKLNDAENVDVEKNKLSKKDKSVEYKDEDEKYDLGDFGNDDNMDIALTFKEAGQYKLEIWCDNNR